MKNSIRSAAEKFVVYSQLGWFGRWRFRRYLRWVSGDAAAMELLLDFEKGLEKRSLSRWQIARLIIDALKWYNSEEHDDHLQSRIQPTRLSEMLQVVIIFLENHKLHRAYRELLLNIVKTGNRFGKPRASTRFFQKRPLRQGRYHRLHQNDSR